MKMTEFFKTYNDEASCLKAFKTMRDMQGVHCKKCQSTEHHWLERRKQYNCKKCGFRTTLKSGTLLQHTKLLYSDWFLVMHLITATKKGFSTAELQRQLGRPRYATVLYLMKKIRMGMGQRDQRYSLEGLVEADEAMIEIAFPTGKDQGTGRGTISKAKVLVMASTQEKHDSKSRIKRSCQYFKMKVIASFDQLELKAQVLIAVDEKATVLTDGFASYKGLEDLVGGHIATVCPPKEAHLHLPWVHIAISNLKRKLLDIHHCITAKYLQLYLNEFCYKLNRRFISNPFDRLLLASTTMLWNPRCMDE